MVSKIFPPFPSTRALLLGRTRKRLFEKTLKLRNLGINGGPAQHWGLSSKLQKPPSPCPAPSALLQRGFGPFQRWEVKKALWAGKKIGTDARPLFSAKTGPETGRTCLHVERRQLIWC